VANGAEHCCGFEQFLRWDATDVETRTTELVSLDKADVKASACSIECCGISCRSTANDNEIMMSHMADSLASEKVGQLSVT
jgi:hypothetical protein